VSEVQIFMSYARDDNAAPPGVTDAQGFISALHGQLEFKFQDLGRPRPLIWWDKRKIEDGEFFDPKIERAIEQSALLVIVLSRNWLHRPYCLRELELFRNRWSNGDDFSDVRHRIIIARKNHVEEDEIPQLIRGQSGYEFFRYDGPRTVDHELSYFESGKCVDIGFQKRANDLGGYLWRAARNITRRISPPTENPLEELKPRVEVPRNGRTVYLAKPARDMRQIYQRIERELYQWGFDVLPGLLEDVPLEGAAAGFVDDALSKAECAIHLLGDDPGYAPADADRIVPLQLAQTAIKAETDIAKPGARAFHRIIWAPKILEEKTAAADVPLRDPSAVLKRFGCDAKDDIIEGDTSSRFIDALRDHLMRTAPQVEKATLQGVVGDARVYLYHAEEDSEYAADLAAELVQLQNQAIEPLLPAFDGTPNDQSDLHRKNLEDCDAVVMCWASASEVWIRAHSHELKDWQGPHRPGKFAFRGLIAGPPPGTRKKILLRIPPRSQIDRVLDLTEPKPLAEALSGWFFGTQPTAAP
jgi:hypothetical protein